MGGPVATTIILIPEVSSGMKGKGVMITAPALPGLWYLGLAQCGDDRPWLCRNSSLCCPEGEKLLASSVELPSKGRIW